MLHAGIFVPFFWRTCWKLRFLFCRRDVHAVCLWDDKGPAKIHQALKEDILDFIKQAQAVSRTGAKLECVISLPEMKWIRPNHLCLSRWRFSEGAQSPRWYCTSQGLHCGVEEVLHTVWYTTQAILPAWDHTDGQTREQQEVQRGGQHSSEGEPEHALSMSGPS